MRCSFLAPWRKSLGAYFAALRLSVLLLLIRGSLTATGPAWVSDETELREAIARNSVDTIYVASFTLSGEQIIVRRSVSIIGLNCYGDSCGSGDEDSGCTLRVNASAPQGNLFHVEAAGPMEILVYVERVKFVATCDKPGAGSSSQGAIGCSGPHRSVLQLKDVLFDGFRASRGVVSIAGVGCTVTCTSCMFVNNEALTDGGAAFVTFGSFACYGCSFSRNHASRGGAVFVGTGGHAELQHPRFSGNVAEVGGSDVFIENAAFATLTYCPESSSPNATGSQRLPVGNPACTHSTVETPPTNGTPSTTLPDTGTIFNIPWNLSGWPANTSEGLPPGPSGLLLYTLSGVSQVSAGYPFGLWAVIVLAAQRVDDVVLDLVVGRQDGRGDGCSGFLLDAVTPSQGGCNVTAASGGQAGACAVSCDLGQVQWANPVVLKLTLRAVAVGAVLAMDVTVLSRENTSVPLPVQVMQASGARGEPIHAVDARQPIIAPAGGAVGSLRQLLGNQGAAVFVGASEVLSFEVIGPGLGHCNLTSSILINGSAQVVNVTRGEEGTSLLALEVVTAPDSAIVLQVAAAACVGADGQASVSSEPFPVLVDFKRPSAVVTARSGRRMYHVFDTFTIQFSERVFNFSEGGIQVSGSHLTCFAALNESAGTYAAVVKPSEGASSFSVFVKEGAAVDVAGNPCTASNMATNSHYHRRSLLTKTVSRLFQFMLGMSVLVLAVDKKPSQGRLLAFVGRLQFFQMISFLDIPLDNTLGDILRDLAWVNNGWSHPVFEVGGGAQSVPLDASEQEFFFPSNGSCRAQADDGLHPDIENTGRKLLEDTVGGGWPRMAFTELNALLHDAHPRVSYPKVVAMDELLHLNSQSDFWAIVIYSVCQLLFCLVIRAGFIVLWRAMLHFRPRPFWKSPPAILLFPRLELLVLLLTFPTMTQACMFYATSGFDWGVLIGACVGVCYPLAFVTFAFYFIINNILVKEECSFQLERIYLVGGADNSASQRASLYETKEDKSGRHYGSSQPRSLGIPAYYREPLLLESAWLDRGAGPGRDFVLQYGLLFQDLKGPSSYDMVDLRPALNLGRMSTSSRASSEGRTSLNLDAWNPRPAHEEPTLHEWTPEPSRWLPRWMPHGSFLRRPARCHVTHGHLSAAYMLLILFKQFAFAALTGMSYRHLTLANLGSFQVGFMVAWLLFHVAYLIMVQPYVSQLTQAAEFLAMLCELGSIACCVALVVLDEDNAAGLSGTFSSIILLFLFLSTIVSLVALWSGIPRAARDFWQTARGNVPRWLLCFLDSNPGVDDEDKELPLPEGRGSPLLRPMMPASLAAHPWRASVGTVAGGRVDGRMDGRSDGRMDGRSDGRMDGGSSPWARKRSSLLQPSTAGSGRRSTGGAPMVELGVVHHNKTKNGAKDSTSSAGSLPDASRLGRHSHSLDMPSQWRIPPVPLMRRHSLEGVRRGPPLRWVNEGAKSKDDGYSSVRRWDNPMWAGNPQWGAAQQGGQRSAERQRSRHSDVASNPKGPVTWIPNSTPSSESLASVPNATASSHGLRGLEPYPPAGPQVRGVPRLSAGDEARVKRASGANRRESRGLDTDNGRPVDQGGLHASHQGRGGAPRQVIDSGMYQGGIRSMYQGTIDARLLGVVAPPHSPGRQKGKAAPADRSGTPCNSSDIASSASAATAAASTALSGSNGSAVPCATSSRGGPRLVPGPSSPVDLPGGSVSGTDAPPAGKPARKGGWLQDLAARILGARGKDGDGHADRGNETSRRGGSEAHPGLGGPYSASKPKSQGIPTQLGDHDLIAGQAAGFQAISQSAASGDVESRTLQGGHDCVPLGASSALDLVVSSSAPSTKPSLGQDKGRSGHRVNVAAGSSHGHDGSGHGVLAVMYPTQGASVEAGGGQTDKRADLLASRWQMPARREDAVTAAGSWARLQPVPPTDSPRGSTPISLSPRAPMEGGKGQLMVAQGSPTSRRGPHLALGGMGAAPGMAPPGVDLVISISPDDPGAS